METPRRSRAHPWILAAALLGPAVPLISARVLDPDPRGVGTHEQLGMEPCTMLDLTGWPCPGCGVTTAVTLAGEGRLVESFLTQPLGFLLVAFAAFFLPWAAVAHFRGRDLGLELRGLPVVRTCLTLAALIGAAWVYKIARML